jgi:uncharacterized protein (DUF983 family)
VTRDPDAPTTRLLGRGLRRRCPRCGDRPFVSYFELAETCPSCGLRFEREEGYWAGALIVNTTVTFLSFLVVFVGGVLLTWPDVPWAGLMAVTIGVNLVLPILFYPISKTVWSAMELSWHPLEEDEIDDADSSLRSP